MGTSEVPQFPIVALVGSTRFLMEIAEIARRETLAGKIVLRPHVVKSRALPKAPITVEQREMLDALRDHEIDIADELLVVNIGGYIGQSTVRHIDHAVLLGKPIRYEEPLPQVKRCLLCNGSGERRTLDLGAHSDRVESCPRCAGLGEEPS